MSRNLLRRVEQVNRTSERVMAGNLSDRVPLHGTGDEFDQLAANLNRMLEQIERLMTAMREVTDDVAHDLKTPLSRLRTRLERALADPSGGSGQREAIRAAIDEADRLLATFNALLSIAELESGAGSDKTEPLDLSEIARAAAELYEPVAEENGFALGLQPSRACRFAATATSCRRRSPICSTMRSNMPEAAKSRSASSRGAHWRCSKWPTTAPAFPKPIGKPCSTALSASNRAARRPATALG